MTTTPTTTRTVGSPRPGTCTINHHYVRPEGGRVTHRTDGPANLGIYPDDDSNHLVMGWIHHHKPSRLDGPALTLSSSDAFWIVDGIDIARLALGTNHP